MQKRTERGARAHSSISSTRKPGQKPVKRENESKGAREREHERGRESSGERWGALAMASRSKRESGTECMES